MSFLRNLINPPPARGANTSDHYDFFKSVNDSLNGLTSVRNPTVVTNANFATLGPDGLTPITQGDGDNAEFSDGWFVVGATAANYVITPTTYPTNSTVKSSSNYYINTVVSTTNGGPFYFYQRQPGTVRQYQQDYLIYGLMLQNNLTTAVKLRMDVFSYYDTGSNLASGSTFFLQPGLQLLTSKVLTTSLNGVTVGAGNYTDFRFNFIDVPGGVADIDIYQIKCEFGQISTPL